jgi:UDP-N-acetylglucosamine 4-epimerase
LNALLSPHQYSWLITGAAGFIGSHLLEALLKADQTVTALDNFSTGHQRNLDQVRELVSPSQWARLTFIEGDIREPETCVKACRDVEYVLHQAALGSVPRSLADPLASHESNGTGFLNMLIAARDAKVKRFVYAASSSTYGDHPALPKEEDTIGKPLSPYAVTKYLNELYADVFARNYGLRSRGLRYFNVFGPRQDPNGAYAAVIPLWIASMIHGKEIFINGDGTTSRDFCFVNNAVQANIRAALCNDGPRHEVFNVAVGDRTNLTELFELLRSNLAPQFKHLESAKPIFRDFRAGDVLHSLANISRARERLGYEPTHKVAEGLDVALDWYIKNA